MCVSNERSLVERYLFVIFLSFFLEIEEVDYVPKALAENLSLSINKIQFMFEIENLDLHVPRMCMRASVHAQVQDVWSNKVQRIAFLFNFLFSKFKIFDAIAAQILENLEQI